MRNPGINTILETVVRITQSNGATEKSKSYIKNSIHHKGGSRKGFFKRNILCFYSVAPLLRVSNAFFRIILLFLFIAGFSTWDAQAGETPICAITQEVSSEGKKLLLIRNQDSRTEFDSLCKELEEINGSRIREKVGMDRQTEILEKLLTESLKTTTVRPSP